MRAAQIVAFSEPLEIGEVPDPLVPADGVVLRVEATGVCRSDWHAWVGHEALPSLPHVLGHEMAGVVDAIGPEVRDWKEGDRVTVPFSMGCGICASCRAGHLNTCDRPFTPGFSHWGSFAELVALSHADANLVRIPDELASVHAAALGCRFITSFRAVVDKARVGPGEWLAVHGCGGVGLSAIMIGKAIGARVVAVDIAKDKLAFATELGADAVVDAADHESPHRLVREVTGGGAHASIDALGITSTSLSSLKSLRKHGRHIQVGLMHGDDAAPPIPMEPVIMKELELLGSRGMPAHDYPRVLEMIASGVVDPARLVTKTVTLDEAPAELAAMGSFAGVGVTVIDGF